MSITFSTPAARLAHVAVECWDDSFRALAVTRSDADQVAAAHAADCTACRGHGGPVRFEVHDPVEVNVSNANAALLLDLLGLVDPTAWAGRVDGADFLGRVLLAQAIAPTDAGRPVVQAPAAAGGGWVIDCGRPAGYAQDRLAQLRSIAAAATAASSTVDWS